MMGRKRKGRPMASRDVKVTPEFRRDVDVEKLGRALIAVALSIAQKKEREEAEKAALASDKEDRMT